MEWFGESWGAAVCRPETHVETPVGEPCRACGVPIEAGERGVVLLDRDRGGVAEGPMHVDCLLDLVVPEPKV